MLDTARQQQLRALGYASYKDYLASSHWSKIKADYRASGRPRYCLLCGESAYQLHHITYERLGQEVLEDLLPLCQRDHSIVHEAHRRGLCSLDPREYFSRDSRPATRKVDPWIEIRNQRARLDKRVDEIRRSRLPKPPAPSAAMIKKFGGYLAKESMKNRSAMG